MSNKRLKVDICPFLRKFYASVNAIMNHSKYVNEDVKLCLFATSDVWSQCHIFECMSVK